MTVASEVVEVQKNGPFTAGVGVDCALQTPTLDYVSVRYGDAKVLATLTTHYTLALSTDMLTVTVTPTAALVALCNTVGIGNKIFVKRATPATNGLTESDTFLRRAIVNEINAGSMRDAELKHSLAEAGVDITALYSRVDALESLIGDIQEAEQSAAEAIAAAAQAGISAAAAATYATAAYNSAEAAALFAGVTRVFATKALMDAAAAGIAANAFVLVVTDETNGSMSAIWQKQAGVMTWLRNIGGGGFIVDVRQFGITGSAVLNSTNETAKFELLRQFLLTHDASSVIMQPTMYEFMSPKLFFGVKNVFIYAIGTKFHNRGAGTYGGSDMNAALYLGSGPITHSMVTGSVIDGAGNPSPGVSITSGELLVEDAIRTTKTVVIPIADAGKQAVGSNVLIHWYPTQAVTYPPNPGFHEYNVVDAIVLNPDTSKAILTVRYPLRNTYRITSPDRTTYGVSYGKARITNLNRADYVIAERQVLWGGEGIVHGTVVSPLYDGVLEICGVLETELHGHQRFPGFVPTMCKTITGYGTADYWQFSELDKIIDEIKLANTRFNKIQQGTGVNYFEMVGGSLTGEDTNAGVGIRAKRQYYEGVEVLSQGVAGTPATLAQIAIGAYPCDNVEFKRCKWHPNSNQKYGVIQGNIVPFTPDAVTPTSITVNVGNANYGLVIQGAAINHKITCNAGTQADVFTIEDITFDSSDNLVLLGRTNKRTPALASVQRLLWLTHRVIFHDDNQVFNPPNGFRRVNPNRSSWIFANDYNNGLTRHHIVFRRGIAYNHDINGVLIAAHFHTQQAESGTDTLATLAANRGGPGGPSWGAGVTINVKTAARRSVTVGANTGSQTGDTLTDIPQNMECEYISFNYKGDGAAGVFNDADPEDLGLTYVTLEVEQVP